MSQSSTLITDEMVNKAIYAYTGMPSRFQGQVALELMRDALRSVEGDIIEAFGATAYKPQGPTTPPTREELFTDG